MTVYVDDMYKYPIGQFGRMKMSHMMADTTEELFAMAAAIGVAARWIQDKGQYGEHFDIAIAKRKLAIAYGAREITLRQMAAYNSTRRLLGWGPGKSWDPVICEEWQRSGYERESTDAFHKLRAMQTFTTNGVPDRELVERRPTCINSDHNHATVEDSWACRERTP